MEPHRSRQISFRGSDGNSIFANSNTHHVDIVLQTCSQPFNNKLSISHREQSLTAPIRGGDLPEQARQEEKDLRHQSPFALPQVAETPSPTRLCQPAISPNQLGSVLLLFVVLRWVNIEVISLWSPVWLPICNSTSASRGLGLQAHDTRPS